MFQTRIVVLFSFVLLSGLVTGKIFAYDPDQSVLDFVTSYVILSTSAHSKIHCGVICITKLRTCSYYVYDVTTNTCYGRQNALVERNTLVNLTTVATWTKMMDITNRQKEFRTCVLEKSGILVGNTTCLHMSDSKISGLKAENYCSSSPVSGRLFEPRSKALSDHYKLPLLEHGYIKDNLPYWIGLNYNPTEGIYYWLSDGLKASYTDWCTENCANFPPQPDVPAFQWCTVTVFLHNHADFGWWDKSCTAKFIAICEIASS